MGWVVTTSKSGDPYVDGLLARYKWAGGTIGYSFPEKLEWTGYSGTGEAGDNAQKVNAAQQTAAHWVMAEIKALTGYDIRDYNFAPDFRKIADIRFGRTTWSELDTAAAYLPESGDKAGDVWFSSTGYLSPVPGNYSYFTFLHEVGHAFGLEHPHDGPSPGEKPFAAMPADKDHVTWTVMSYKSFQGAEPGYINGLSDFPQTYMMYDIATLQHMYGANYGHNSSDTVYTWSPLNGTFSINGGVAIAPSGNRVFMTIWDGGGTDTYDFSAYGANLKVDLAPGAWTTTTPSQIADLGEGNKAPGNIANALLHKGNPASLIENAIGGLGDDDLKGNQAANRLEGRGGNDVLDGRAGADTLVGGEGNDTYHVDDMGDVVTELSGQGQDVVFASTSWTLTEGAEVERLELVGISASARTLTGNSAANLLVGTVRNDILDGGAGADTMNGFDGDDIYVVDNAGDVVNAGGGINTIRSSISWTLGSTIWHLELSGGAAIDGTGNLLANNLTGNDAANRLDGREGGDRMAGKGGDDTYVVDDSGDTVVELAGGGDDLVLVTAAYTLSTYTLGAEIERATLAGGGMAVSLVGNDAANVLTGSAASNRLDGRGGADTLIGGMGADLYVVDNSGDMIVELAGEGDADGVEASADYILPANVEHLILTGFAIRATGNDGANKLFGNHMGNVLDGKGGADEMTGGTGDDDYYVDHEGDRVVEQGGEGTDRVWTTVSFTLGANVENGGVLGTASVSLYGNGLANRLQGNGHGGLLAGGGGDDQYLVNNVGITVLELAGEGVDTINAVVNYILPDHVENLTLTFFAVSGTGNSGANVLTGTSANNRLDGAGGADRMIGLEGDDIYVVDEAGDVVVEAAGGGDDHVLVASTYTTLSYSLAAHVERGTLNGGTAQWLYGNDLANTLTGDAADNILDGGIGADTLIGGLGNDLFLADSVYDVAVEQAGGGDFDVVRASVSYVIPAHVEQLWLIGAAAVNATGNDAANRLLGNEFANTLDGKGGADEMLGGAGNDTYVVDHDGDRVVEQAGEGTDSVRSSVSFVLGDHVENLTLTGSAVSAVGNAGANTLTGTDGANVLDGKGGSDVMRGLAGDDVYHVDAAGDAVEELAGGGTDTVHAAFSYTLGAHLENLVLAGSAAIDGTGNAGANRIDGNGSANRLDGGAGGDRLAGGGGDDVYIVDDAGDQVVEAADGGDDRVETGLASYTLGDHVERLAGTSGAGQQLFGNALGNAIVGGGGQDTIRGGGGDDLLSDAGGSGSLYGEGGNDRLSIVRGDGAAETHTLDGGAGDDEISVSISRDVLLNISGGDGADRVVLERLSAGSGVTVSLGEGSDILLIGAVPGHYRLAAVTLTDFAAGPGGDRIDFDAFVAAHVVGHIPGSNPFASGSVILVQDGADALLQIDFDGGGDSYHTLVTFRGLDQAALDASNVGHDIPRNKGTAGNDRISGSAADETFTLGSGGDDQVFARGGNDTILFGGAFTAADTVDGGEGTDELVLQGHYGAVTDLRGVTGVERLTLLRQEPGAGGGISPPSPYALWSPDSTVAAGALLVVDGSTLGAGDPLDFNGSGETDGRLDVTGGSAGDTLRTGAGSDRLDGGAGDDLLDGGAGDDVYLVDSLNDHVVERAAGGIDEIRTALSAFSLDPHGEVERLTGTSAAGQTLTGNASDNLVAGGAGNDRIDGRAGADRMRGGAGNDVYEVDNAGDVVEEKVGEGTDEVRTALATASIRAFDHVEALTGTGFAQLLIGNDLANTIAGTGGNDVIEGEGGADTMTGGLGDDTYRVGEAGDIVVENQGEGTDRILTALASYSLAGLAHVEILVGTSDAGHALTGNGLANLVMGAEGADRLDGGAGADEMVGRGGNDLYIVDDAGDLVTEAAGGGSADEVRTALASYTLGTELENLTGTSASGQTLTGNALGNYIVGGMGDDVIHGMGGDDIIVGFAGADILRGGGGNDVYAIDASDTVIELDGDGIDEIRTVGAIYVLGVGLENLRATSDIGHDFRGNLSANAIIGGDGNDIIRLQDGGDDVAYGKNGVDSFYFGGSFDGYDYVDGGASRDSLLLQGNYDVTLVYLPTGRSSIANVEGISLVSGSNASFGDTAGRQYSYKLKMVDDNVFAGNLMKVNGFTLQAGENFTLDASAETDAALQILGGLGTDNLTGGAQGDAFVFGHDGRFAAGDKVVGGGGYDVVYLRGDYTVDFNAAGFAGALTGVESIALLTSANTEFLAGGDGDFDYQITWADSLLAAGGTFTVNGSRLQSFETFVFDGSAETNGSLRVFGGNGNDTLKGGAAADQISGGGGVDQLTGGAGADLFRFLLTSDSTAAAFDTVTDFVAGVDKIDVGRIDAKASTPDNEAFAYIGGAAFSASGPNAAGELRAFNVSGGLWQVEADVNGDGVADLMLQVHVAGGQPLTIGDFVV